MRVRVYDVEAFRTLRAECDIAECFPGDAEGLAEALADIAKHGCHWNGGGSAPTVFLQPVTAQERHDQQEAAAICAKWVKRLGWGFHPDTRGASYIMVGLDGVPSLSPEGMAEYDADMERLFACDCDPYALALAAMEAGVS